MGINFALGAVDRTTNRQRAPLQNYGLKNAQMTLKLLIGFQQIPKNAQNVGQQLKRMEAAIT
jgi:hypothetical protein